MSELKVASLFELEKVLQGRSNKLFYSKSEADAYIAELKSERDGAMGLNLIGMTLEDYQAAADKEFNRQKRLRCEALIQVCMAKNATWMSRFAYAETEWRQEVCYGFAMHYKNRTNTLREILKKLKEAK